MSRYSKATPEYREQVKARSRERRLEDPQRYLWDKAKRRAKQQKLDFDITPEDIKIPLHCPALGIPIQVLSGVYDQSATVDRVNPARGYVKGNIPVISRRANRIKNDATADELMAIGKWLRGFYNIDPKDVPKIKKICGVK